MDPRLIRYYNLELQHLHEMGAEFAREFPKVAARLGMNELEVADPYVERLLEGVAFLAARVQLKIDAEFPRFTQALLEIVHPHYLAPTPSMVVVQMKPNSKETGLASGTRTVPRGTTMQAEAGAEATACEFRTAQDVTLWPVEVAAASYFSYAPDLPLNALPIGGRIKGGVRIRLKAASGIKFSQMPLDRLVFFLTGADEVANKLCELCLGTALGAMVTGVNAGERWHAPLPASGIRPLGFADDQALLPVTARSFQGYRLLQEYFAFPQRFRFVEVVGLQQALRRANSDEVELVLLFGRAAPAFETVVDASNFALFCTPAINLLERRLDRIHVTEGEHEFHVVPDRTRPLDFEIYAVNEVTGFGVGSDSQQVFLPFYAAYSTHEPHQHTAAYFTLRRAPRLVSSAQKRRGPRSSYLGTEVFISLVDPAQAPYSGSLRQLSVQGLCTNRDLVLQMPVGSAQGDFTLDISAPVVGVRVVAGPSRPFAPLADGNVAWRVISHLALNYLSLANSPGHGAAALRDLLELYAPSADAGARKQVEGVRSVRVAPVVRRLHGQGPLAFGRGLEITTTIDEMAFEGASGFLLGSVLHRFFSRHVSINSFTETVLRSEGRGEIGRFEPQWGARPTL